MIKGSEEFKEMIYNLMIGAFDLEHYPIEESQYVANEYEEGEFCSKAYEEVYGKQPIPVRSGGSIPIIATFEEVLGIKSILMGFGLGADAIHSPNENYPLEQFFNGIRTIPLFYKHFVEDVH